MARNTQHRAIAADHNGEVGAFANLLWRNGQGLGTLDVARGFIFKNNAVSAIFQKTGKLTSERRTLLEGVVVRDGQQIFHGLAFNDVVVSRGAGAGMVELRVEVDGHFMYNQRSDGLIVSTPTGSTAYALAAGGPMLQPELGGVVLVPIAPHALSNRPIVLSDNHEISIELVSAGESSVNFDMQSLTSLAQHDRVLIRRSAHTVTFLHPEGWNYFDTLREKLHWNEYPSVLGQLK